MSTGSAETVFTYGSPQLKFGRARRWRSATSRAPGVRRVLVVTDPRVAATGQPRRVGGAR